jgi:PEGA domain
MHCRRITLIVFYLIGATLRGLLGGRHSLQGEGPKLRGIPPRLYGRVLGRGGPMPPRCGIMSRVIAVTACCFMLTACSAKMPSLSLDFMKSAPQAETLAIESEPPGAEAKTSSGQSCRTPCQLVVQPGSEVSVTLALSGYQPQTVSVRPDAEGASAAPRLAPNPVHVTLQAVKPPKKPVAKKKTPVAAAARPAASPPVASAGPTAAPAPASKAAPAPTPASSSSAEVAPSATNYPWPSR